MNDRAPFSSRRLAIVYYSKYIFRLVHLHSCFNINHIKTFPIADHIRKRFQAPPCVLLRKEPLRPPFQQVCEHTRSLCTFRQVTRQAGATLCTSRPFFNMLHEATWPKTSASETVLLEHLLGNIPAVWGLKTSILKQYVSCFFGGVPVLVLAGRTVGNHPGNCQVHLCLKNRNGLRSRRARQGTNTGGS